MISAQEPPVSKFQVVVVGLSDSSAGGLEALQKRFADKFKLSPEKVQRLLAKFPAAVKVEAERVRAEKWITMLEAIGAICEIRESTGGKTAIRESKSPQPAEPPIELIAEQKPAPAAMTFEVESPGLAIEADPERMVSFEVSTVKSAEATPDGSNGVSPAASPSQEFGLAFEPEQEPAPVEAPPPAAPMAETLLTEAQQKSDDEQHFQLSNLMQLVGDNAAPPPFAQAKAPDRSESLSVDSSQPVVSVSTESQAASPPAEGASASDAAAAGENSAGADDGMGKMVSFIPKSVLPPVGSPNRNRRFAGICAAASITFLVALAGLAAYGPAPGPSIHLSQSDITRLLAAQKEILGAKAGSIAPVASKPIDLMLKDSTIYSGSVVDPLISGSISVKLFEDKIVELSVDITGKPGEKLSSEMLVAGIKRSPWITKIEAPAVHLDTSRLDQPPLSIRGIAKAYVEDDTGGARYAVDLRAVGTKLADENQIELKLVFTNVNPIPEQPSASKIERLKGDRFSILVPVTVTVAKKSAAPPVEPGIPVQSGSANEPPPPAAVQPPPAA